MRNVDAIIVTAVLAGVAAAVSASLGLFAIRAKVNSPIARGLATAGIAIAILAAPFVVDFFVLALKPRQGFVSIDLGLATLWFPSAVALCAVVAAAVRRHRVPAN